MRPSGVARRRTSYKENHTDCESAVLSKVYFTQYTVFEIHPCRLLIVLIIPRGILHSADPPPSAGVWGTRTRGSSRQTWARRASSAAAAKVALPRRAPRSAPPRAGPSAPRPARELPRAARARAFPRCRRAFWPGARPRRPGP